MSEVGRWTRVCVVWAVARREVNATVDADANADVDSNSFSLSLPIFSVLMLSTCAVVTISIKLP
jgi:hypothetical protein